MSSSDKKTKKDRISKRGVVNEGRPPVDEPTPEQVALINAILKIGGTIQDVADETGLKKRTIQRRFGALIKNGKRLAGLRLRTDLFRESRNGKVAASIFLACQNEFGLGFVNTMRNEITGKDGQPLSIMGLARAADKHGKKGK